MDSIKQWFRDWSDACQYAKECVPDLSFLIPREPLSALVSIVVVCFILWWWNERKNASVDRGLKTRQNVPRASRELNGVDGKASKRGLFGAFHVEKHFLNSEFVRDVVIGMADGLTVPFALAAGISAAGASTHLVVTAGLAEIVAGAIAMGLGGYLAARSDQEHFLSEERREYSEVDKLPDQEQNELREIFSRYGLQDPHLEPVIAALSADKKRWVDFMMRFELGLEQPNPQRAPASAATIAASYFIGGLIPLAPYIIETDVKRALLLSVVLTGIALIVFGAVKGSLTGVNPFRSGLQTLLVGGLAAGAAYYLASMFA
jgi:VIT1/CCC1 family predicted Fe2+/Mn2+ transporter